MIILQDDSTLQASVGERIKKDVVKLSNPSHRAIIWAVNGLYGKMGLSKLFNCFPFQEHGFIGHTAESVIWNGFLNTHEENLRSADSSKIGFLWM